MKFSANVKSLVAAVDRIGGVRPSFPRNNEGYLFSVRDDTCYVYSRDAQHVARSSFPVVESEGDVDFIYPLKAVEAFRYLHDTITFDVAGDVNFTVGYSSTSGASAMRSTVNPAMLARCEEDLQEVVSKAVFPAGILQLALNQAKSYASKDQELRKVIQIFDGTNPECADGNGIMFACDGVRIMYFECDEFKDKPLAISSEHVGLVCSFLGKCEGNVIVHNGANMIFFEDRVGDLLGVTRKTVQYQRFSRQNVESDPFILSISKDRMVASLKYLRAEAPPNKDSINVLFEVGSRALLFSMADNSSKANSMPVVVNALREDITMSQVACTVNVDHMIDLLEATQSNNIDMRMFVRSDGIVLFRIVDEFFVNKVGKVLVDRTQEGAIKCKTFRMLPSKV